MKNKSKPKSAMTVSGCYGLNTDYNTETVAHVYKALWTVEDIIRTAKRFWKPDPSTTSATKPFVAMSSAASLLCYSKPSWRDG
jgi:hypothetical protein